MRLIAEQKRASAQRKILNLVRLRNKALVAFALQERRPQ
jgi:hypothetical protein